MDGNHKISNSFISSTYLHKKINIYYPRFTTLALQKASLRTVSEFKKVGDMTHWLQRLRHMTHFYT